MTEPTTPLSDEDLSAHLDHEAGDAVARRLADDPQGQRRLEQLGAARAALADGAPSPLPDAEVDRLVAAALATGHEGAGPLAPAGAGRGRPAGPPPWLVAAGIAVLLAVGLALVWSGRGADDDQTASAPTTTVATKAGGGSASPAPESDRSADQAGTTAQDSFLPDHGGVEPNAEAPATTIAPGATTLALGAFPDAAALRQRLAAAFPSDAATAEGAAPSTAEVARCAQQMRLTFKLDGDPQHQGWATVGAKRVLVYEWASRSYRDGSPTTLVTAVGADACDEVAIFER
jgi:hypothetical protein